MAAGQITIHFKVMMSIHKFLRYLQLECDIKVSVVPSAVKVTGSINPTVAIHN